MARLGPRGRLTRHHVAALAAAALGAVACSTPPTAPSPAPSASAATPEPVPAGGPVSPGPARTPDPAFVVRYRVRVEAAGLDAGDVAATVARILTDPRGWSRAGFVFVADGPAAPTSTLPTARITVADGAVIDRLCAPYDTAGRYSCQLGPTVNLNADRWRSATPSWTGDIDDYRTYLVNHEVGHLLGLHHPRPQCPGEGYPAPIMLQQSTELDACTANPWPLQWEVELAASRVEPFAPGYEPEPEHRPSPPPARQ